METSTYGRLLRWSIDASQPALTQIKAGLDRLIPGTNKVGHDAVICTLATWGRIPEQDRGWPDLLGLPCHVETDALAAERKATELVCEGKKVLLIQA